MSKKNVEELLIAGGADENIRKKYDTLNTKDEFVVLAETDGYVFSVQDLDDVLRESGDAFESFGNPPKRVIWWHWGFMHDQQEGIKLTAKNSLSQFKKVGSFR